MRVMIGVDVILANGTPARVWTGQIDAGGETVVIANPVDGQAIELDDGQALVVTVAQTPVAELPEHRAPGTLLPGWVGCLSLN